MGATAKGHPLTNPRLPTKASFRRHGVAPESQQPEGAVNGCDGRLDIS
jgi:hypothetical protein